MAMSFEEMVKAQQEANDKKAMYNTFASVADELSSAPTVGDIMLKRQVKGNAGAGLRAIADSQQDPLALEKLRRDFQDAETANRMKQEQLGLEKEKFGFDKENKTLEMSRKERDQIGDLYSKGVIDPTSPIKFKRDPSYQKPMSPMEQQLAEMNLQLKKNELAKIGQGEKLPASEAVRQGQSNASVQALNDIDKLITEKKDSFGKVASLKGSIGGLFGASQDQAAVNAQLDQAAQTIGTYLEGGKLAEGDMKKYKKMLPQDSDSPELARKKAVMVAHLVAQRQAAEKEALKGSGYNVSGIKDIDMGKFSNQQKEKMPGLLDNTAQAAPMDAPKPHEQDNQAVQWAKANPKDPRAAAILKANGVQ